MVLGCFIKYLNKFEINKQKLVLFFNIIFYLESVFRVPETTFNNMHGKLNHLKTEDANQFLNNRPNALGIF